MMTVETRMLNTKFGTCCMIGGLVTKRNGTVEFQTQKDLKIGTITQLSLYKLHPMGPLTIEQQHHVGKQVFDKISKKALDNVKALYRQIKTVSTWPEELRMFRVSSELLPMFDHPLFNDVYTSKTNDVEFFMRQLDIWFNRIKSIVSNSGIRVMTHPSQYIVVNSENKLVRQKSFVNLYYHKFFMEKITSPQQGSTINVHLNGRLDKIPEFDSGLYTDLREWLSFENEDKIANRGHLFTLQLCELYNIKYLFDIHHYFVENSKYLRDASKINRIVATWNGIKPAMHLSQPKSMENKKSMISHSDMITDIEIVKHISSLTTVFDVDIEIEAKHKNLAAKHFAQLLRNYRMKQ